MNHILLRYLVKNFLKSFFVVFFCFFILISVLESMEIVRKYFSNTIAISSWMIIRLTVYHAISTLFSFFSFIVFLSSLVFFISMHNRLELTVMKVVGFSVKKILLSLCLGVSVLGLFYITVLDTVSAFCVKETKQLDTDLKQKTRGIDRSVAITNSGIWFRGTNNDMSYIISVKSFEGSTSSLYNVRIFEFSEDFTLLRSMHSSKGLIKGDVWELSDCKISDTNGLETFEKSLTLPISLSFAKISKIIANPGSVSFWSINRYSRMLDKVGLSTTKYKVHWYSRIASIFQMFAFVVLVTAFCINYNSRDFRSYAFKNFVLLLFIFPVYFLTNVLVAFGETGVIPLELAAFFIPALILLTGTIVLEKQG